MMLLADAFFVVLAFISGYACMHVGRGFLSLKLGKHEHDHINYCQRFYAQPEQLLLHTVLNYFTYIRGTVCI